jgi:hypothetical protein
MELWIESTLNHMAWISIGNIPDAGVGELLVAFGSGEPPDDNLPRTIPGRLGVIKPEL